MTSRDPDGTPPNPSVADDVLVGLTDQERVTAAIAARAGQRDLTERAVEMATLVGTIHDLAERRARVAITTTSGRVLRGDLTAIALDHLAIETPSDQRVFVRLGTVAVVRPDPAADVPVAQGDRDPAQDLLLLERCARWVVNRPTLGIGPRGSLEVLRGRLLGVSEDLLSLSLDGSRAPVYVAAAAIEVVTVDRATQQ